ncbi:MAG: hypothetical protein V1899_04135 [Planctomycetota bacterium]
MWHDTLCCIPIVISVCMMSSRAEERPDERAAEHPVAVPSDTRVLDSEPPLIIQRVFGENLGSRESASDTADDEEKQDIMELAASFGTTVELPPKGIPLTDVERSKIALTLWEKEEPKIKDFPGPNIGLGEESQPNGGVGGGFGVGGQ